MKRTKSSGNPGTSRGIASSPTRTKRAIFLQGEIDDNLSRTLTPQILRLREESSRPITVFIDSRGGSPEHGNRILGLLRAVGQQGECPEIITVATGDACSAAADFLAQGDYVMAYRHARLVFHGTRTADPEITRQRAEMLEAGLEWEDQVAARRLALGVFGRFLALHMQHAGQVVESRETCGMVMGEYDDLVRKGILDVPALIWVLRAKVGDDAGRLLTTALDEMRRIKGILALYKEFVESKVDPAIFRLVASRIKGERKKARMQLRVLESVVASRLVGEEDWDLRGKSFQDLEADFKQAFELVEGYCHDDLLDLILEYENVFFNAKDLATVRRIKGTMTWEQYDANKMAKTQFNAAVDRAYCKAEPLWQYVTTLCRLLNEGENELEPEDAWHLGLIDEVIGMPLAHRQMTPKEMAVIESRLSVADMQKFV